MAGNNCHVEETLVLCGKHYSQDEQSKYFFAISMPYMLHWGVCADANLVGLIQDFYFAAFEKGAK